LENTPVEVDNYLYNILICISLIELVFNNNMKEAEIAPITVESFLPAHRNFFQIIPAQSISHQANCFFIFFHVSINTHHV
jgi:hypothetical protein